MHASCLIAWASTRLSWRVAHLRPWIRPTTSQVWSWQTYPCPSAPAHEARPAVNPLPAPARPLLQFSPLPPRRHCPQEEARPRHLPAGGQGAGGGPQEVGWRLGGGLDDQDASYAAYSRSTSSAPVPACSTEGPGFRAGCVGSETAVEEASLTRSGRRPAQMRH